LCGETKNDLNPIPDYTKGKNCAWKCSTCKD